MTIHLLCFESQIENSLANYDFADNDYNSEDNCELNCNINRVDAEIDEAWSDISSVPVISPLVIGFSNE